MSRIFYNAMKTPDGTIIESLHRHDYVSHKDANGETYMVDGGIDYLRRSVNPNAPAEDLSTHEIEGVHEHNRQYFRWGTYGKDGREQFRQVLLMDMSTNHIKEILRTQVLSESIKGFFTEELKYREENK